MFPDHQQTIRDLIAGLTPEGRATAIWAVQWQDAWTHCELRGQCDGLGAAEYRRLTAQAHAEGVPPCQAAMRIWIARHANQPPTPTQEDTP